MVILGLQEEHVDAWGHHSLCRALQRDFCTGIVATAPRPGLVPSPAVLQLHQKAVFSSWVHYHFYEISFFLSLLAWLG